MNSPAWLPLSITALALTLTSGLYAQDVPAPAGGDGTVTLQFQHQPGKARKYRFDMKADITITPEAGAGGLGALPVSLKSATTFTEKVTAAEAGEGTISVTPLSMTLDASILGMSTLMKVEGGKATMNGQPIPPGTDLGPLSGLLNGKPVTMRRNAVGALTNAEALSTGAGQMLNSSFLLQLPDKPVKVGESWGASVKMKPNIPVPGGAAPELEVKLTHTLRALETKNGDTHALIDSKGTASSAAGSPEGGLNQNYSGTTRFSVTQGAILSGTYSADIKMQAGVPAALGGLGGEAAPAPQPDQAPKTMNIEGMMSFGLTELPLTAPKPPVKVPAKPVKRAVKKPAKR